MKFRVEITPDEAEYMLRMVMDILKNKPNKAKILR